MKMRSMLAAGAIAASAAVGQAAVTPIGEFTGDVAEGFEGLFSPGGYPGPIDILAGQGTFDDSVAHFIQIAISLYSFPTDTQILPFNGNIMGGAVTGQAEFAFDTPVSQVGLWVGTADILTDSSAVFYDEENLEIESVPISLALGQWDWFGWQSTTPISRVVIKGAPGPGSPIVVDDLRVTFIPEPGSLALLALPAALLGLRRRV